MDYILNRNNLCEKESLKYFQQLINALIYLHSQNITHRDIKIDNLLLDKNLDLKLIDFGLSTKYNDDKLLTQPCGTIVYAAPEVLQCGQYHGMLADVWSSGIVLYGMLSGYLPFCEKDDEINKNLILEGNFEIPNNFSKLATDLIIRMLDINPLTRYTLNDIIEHPWFKLRNFQIIPGIIIDNNKIPVDENIVNLCANKYGKNKELLRESVVNNKFNDDTTLYYLMVKKLKNVGYSSVSDLCSCFFINYISMDNKYKNSKNNFVEYDNEIDKYNFDNDLNSNRNNSVKKRRIFSLNENEKNNVAVFDYKKNNHSQLIDKGRIINLLKNENCNFNLINIQNNKDTKITNQNIKNKNNIRINLGKAEFNINDKAHNKKNYDIEGKIAKNSLKKSVNNNDYKKVKTNFGELKTKNIKTFENNKDRLLTERNKEVTYDVLQKKLISKNNNKKINKQKYPPLEITIRKNKFHPNNKIITKKNNTKNNNHILETSHINLNNKSINSSINKSHNNNISSSRIKNQKIKNVKQERLLTSRSKSKESNTIISKNKIKKNNKNHLEKNNNYFILKKKNHNISSLYKSHLLSLEHYYIEKKIKENKIKKNNLANKNNNGSYTKRNNISNLRKNYGFSSKTKINDKNNNKHIIVITKNSCTKKNNFDKKDEKQNINNTNRPIFSIHNKNNLNNTHHNRAITTNLLLTERDKNKHFNNFEKPRKSFEINKKQNSNLITNSCSKNRVKKSFITINNNSNKKHLDSSSINFRKRSRSKNIRDLSDSPKQKLLKSKTRNGRIPLKMQNQSLDQKLNYEIISERFINQIYNYNCMIDKNNKKSHIGNHNRFYTINSNSDRNFSFLGNSKILKKNKNNSSNINKNKLLKSSFSNYYSNINKKVNDLSRASFDLSNNFTKNNKSNILLKNQNSKLSKISKINLTNNDKFSILRKSNRVTNNFDYIKDYLDIKLFSKLESFDNSTPVKNNFYEPFDLACLFISNKKTSEFCNDFCNKLKKNGIKYNLKGGNSCNIYIKDKKISGCQICFNKIICNNKENFNIYNMKIKVKSGKSSRIIRKIITED